MAALTRHLKSANGGRRRRVDTSATNLLVCAVFVAIFADTAKWAFASTIALAIGYGAIALLMVWASNISARRRMPRLFARAMIEKAIIAISVIHALRGVLSVIDVPPLRVLVGVVYISGPLVFLMLVNRISQYVNDWLVCNTFLALMLPTIAVGLYQYYVDSDFLVFDVYSQGGGIILRNLLEGGSFSRLPSIFASADRFASMSSLMVGAALYLMLLPQRRASSMVALWLLIACAAGLVGTFIGGARSRIFILICATAGAILVNWLMSRRRRGETTYLTAIITRYGIAIGIATFAGLLSILASFPIMEMLSQTFGSSDISDRVGEALTYSTVREGVTVLGNGIGSSSLDGTPGEFGIKSIWEEMGIIFGIAALVGFTMLFWGFYLAVRASLRFGDAACFFALAYPALTFATGMLTGLKSVLELSTGVMIAIFVSFGLARLQLLVVEEYARRLAPTRDEFATQQSRFGS